MSSFQVSDETIRIIVTALCKGKYSSERNHHQRWEKLRALGYGDDQNVEDTLGTHLVSMNNAALHARYNEPMVLEVYHHQHLDVSKVQVLKSVQCYTYQCAEGNTPSMKLYQFLEWWEQQLMSEIIHALPDYQNDQWDYAPPTKRNQFEKVAA
jgi:hypothetical protein